MAEEQIDISTIKPTRFLAFVAKIEAMGLSLVKANDPEDGVLSWYTDWHDVSKIIQHYEAEIKKRDDLLESNHRAYLSLQGIDPDKHAEHMRGGIHD